MNTKLKELLRNVPAEFGNLACGDVYIGAQGVVELNILGHSFPGWCSGKELCEIADELSDFVLEMKKVKWVFAAEMSKLSDAERMALLERNQITRAMTNRQNGVHVFINDKQDTECYINDEEHLTFVCYRPGLDSVEAVRVQLSNMLKQCRKKLKLAYDKANGYLFSDPVKCGEPTYFSMYLHLPALRMAQRMGFAQDSMDELGAFFMPFFETSGDQDPGDIYLLSSPSIQPEDMDEVLVSIEDVANNICDEELIERERLCKKKVVRERIAAACETLTSGEGIKYKDMLGAISMVRMGIYAGVLKPACSVADMRANLSQVYWQTAPAYQNVVLGISKSKERRLARAAYTKDLILNKLGIKI